MLALLLVSAIAGMTDILPIFFSMPPGDQGRRKGLCAGRSVTDLHKSFWEDGGSVRGEGRPFSKKVPFPPHMFQRIKKGGRKTGRLGGEKGDIPRWGYPLP